MAGELLRRSSSSMLSSYHRSSSTGVELEPLFKASISTAASSYSPPSPTDDDGDITVAVVDTPSKYNAVRDLLISFGFFLVGWWGPKFMLPSEEYLLDRKIPYQILNSTDEVVLDLSLDNPLVRPPTVPSTMLIFTSIWVPIIIMCLMFLLSQRSCHEVIVGISSLFLGVGGSEGSTQLLKNWVLRRRPNFYELCEFNMKTRQCEAGYHDLLEAQLSFPSGHSSLSWCGMVVLVWFLLRRRPQSGGKLYFVVCAAVPLAYAAFVASTRIVDHWHHVSDVLTGVFLGCLWGTIGFHAHHLTHSASSTSVSVLPTTVSSSFLSAPKLPSSHE